MKQTQTEKKYAEIVDFLFDRISELNAIDISSAKKKLEEIEEKHELQNGANK